MDPSASIFWATTGFIVGMFATASGLVDVIGHATIRLFDGLVDGAYRVLDRIGVYGDSLDLEGEIPRDGMVSAARYAMTQAGLSSVLEAVSYAEMLEDETTWPATELERIAALATSTHAD